MELRRGRRARQPAATWFDADDTPEERQEIIEAFREDSRDFLRSLRRDGSLRMLFSPVCVEVDQDGNETTRDSTLGQRLTVGNGVTATCGAFSDKTIVEAYRLLTGEDVCILGERESVRGISERGLKVQVIDGPSPKSPQSPRGERVGRCR